MKQIGRWLTVCSMLIPLFAFGQSAVQQGATPTPAERMDKVFDFWNRLDQPGFATVVVKDGQVVYQKVFGLACQEDAVPLTSNSLFNTATLAQPFVGQAVAMLEEQGKLSLEDDIRKFIPELPDLGTPVKLRHLLYHSSGLRDWLPVLQLKGRDQLEITMESVLGVLKAQKKLLFTPGDRVQYTSTDYDLLSETVKRVTGKPFSDWAFENVFKPLKMNRAQFRENYRAVLDDLAFSYNFTRKEYLRGIDTLSLAGSHSLFTSVSELSKWMLNLGTGRVGGPALIEKMFTPGKLNDGRSSGYGCGLSLGEQGGRRQASLSGTWAGSGFILGYFPDQKFGFVVLANWDYTPVEGFGSDIIDIWLPATAPAPPMAEKAKPAPIAKKGIKVKPAILDLYAGDYRLGPGQVFTLRREGDRLFLVIPGQKFALAPLSETEFLFDLAQARIVFKKDKDGKFGRFIWKQGGFEQEAPKVFMMNPTPAELQEFAGAYSNDELDLKCALEVRGDRLVIIPPERAEVRLAPDEKDRFTSGSNVLPKMIFLRDAGNRVTGFIIDSDAVRDLVFKRI
jgi:CubicO group peptidase (beta-lactamase class C family)